MKYPFYLLTLFIVVGVISCSEEKLEAEAPMYLTIPDDTRIEVSTQDFSVKCPGYLPCLTVFEDRNEVLNPLNEINSQTDPLFLGIPSGTQRDDIFDCPVPPPPPGEGGRAISTGDRPTYHPEIVDTLRKGSIPFLYTQRDYQQPYPGTFLSVSAFDISYAHALRIYPEDIRQPGPYRNSFTVTDGEQYITVVKAQREGYVLRIAYKEKDRLARNVWLK